MSLVSWAERQDLLGQHTTQAPEDGVVFRLLVSVVFSARRIACEAFR